MLPFSLTDGWNVMSDNDGIKFEAAWGGEHVVSSIKADDDDVIIQPVAGSVGPELVIRLDVFEQMTTHTIVTAHTTPGADRG